MDPSSPSTAHLIAASASLGVLFHISILPIEVDTIIGKLIVGFYAAWAGLVLAFANTWGLELLVAIGNATLACLSFSTALGASIAIYRLFFHRLRCFPGPRAAKLSRFYTFSRIKNTGFKYHLELQEMHRKYGDFVRTGPREVSVNRPSAVRSIHGPQSTCTKSTWYSQISDDLSKINMFAVRDHEAHRLRRKAWDRGVGTKALSGIQHLMREKVDIFAKQLENYQGQSINFSVWALYYTFDTMGFVAFGKDFKQVDEAAEHYVIAAMRAQMQFIGLLGAVPWLMHLLICIPGLSGPYNTFIEYCTKQIEERKARWEKGSDKEATDVISGILKAQMEDPKAGPLTKKAFQDEGMMVIVAGSETSGAVLTNALYYLATHPPKYARLQRELDAAAATGHGTSHVPYLEAVINETLRLKPPILHGMPRETPPEGLFIDEVWIPGNTIVLTPQYVLQRDERYFVRPGEFLPERWLDEGKDLVLDDRAFFPFGIGAYGCVGKSLAYMQMRMLLRGIASQFDCSIAPGEDAHAFDANAQDTMTMTVPPLQMMFKKRQVL